MVVAGPTASGKTALSIRLAEHFQSEIISFDSRQFYREMPIGTAAPDAAQRSRVRHHFIGDRSCTSPLNAGEYEREATPLLQRLFERHPILIAVGGSGLFLQALTEGFDDMGPSDQGEARLYWSDFFRTHGLAALQNELRQRDPAYAAVADLNNHQRLIRALEVVQLTCRPYSEHRKGRKTERPYRLCLLGLNPPRALLHQRIEQRVHRMIEAGLENEAHLLYPLRHLKSLQTVGYTEWFQHFEGRLLRQEVAEQILFHTRSYARRQITWFRKKNGIRWFEREDDGDIIPYIEQQSEWNGR